MSELTQVYVKMLCALRAHREYHDIVAREHGMGRCLCVLCVNDDAAINLALRLGKAA